MKISLISGSHRTRSESGRIARYVKGVLETECSRAVEAVILDLGQTPLPLWDEGVESMTPVWQTVWAPISKTLAQSDAIVVVTPEWNGMAPAALKNLFLLCSRDELAHKAGLIVAVSSNSEGGSYPVAELRMSSYKNTRLCYIPEHVIIAGVKDMFCKPGAPSSKREVYVHKRLLYALELLLVYAQSLRLVRESGVADSKTYPYGM